MNRSTFPPFARTFAVRMIPLLLFASAAFAQFSSPPSPPSVLTRSVLEPDGGAESGRAPARNWSGNSTRPNPEPWLIKGSAQSSVAAPAPAKEPDFPIARLEATGEYVERSIRVPRGNSGQAKFIKFLIPVYREKGK